jgi:hypothetical protein
MIISSVHALEKCHYFGNPEKIMTETIQFQSRIGDNGILDLHVPLREIGAGADVVVTIRRVPTQSMPNILDPAEWHRLLDESYGSCVGLGLQRPPQGEFETREPVE